MPADYVTDDVTRTVIDNDEIGHFAEEETEDEGADNRYIPGMPWDEKEALKGKNESWAHFFRRHGENIRHFLVEDWFTSAALGIGTTVLSVVTDLGIESLIHWRRENFEYLHEQNSYYGIAYWLLHFVICTAIASLCCKYISPQAAGSGIPEVKVIISGFVLDNYLSLKTLAAKMVGLIFTIGGGLPVGKEGPFVHMGAIVASLLSKATSKMRHNAFFTNEAREIEMLSMGCAVGIACTFSAPIGAVLYGIECTSKYFAVKNYWKCFFAAAAAAFSFRFAINTLVPPHIAGTIIAYYQTSFPNEVFIIEEIPIFALMGVVCGLMGALFVFINRQIFLFQKQNKLFQKVFGKNLTVFAVLWALNMAIWTYPEGLGRFVAGKWTFHVTLADFISNCTFHQMNLTDLGCKPEIVNRWTGGDGSLDFQWTLACFMVFYFLLVAQCITLFIPSGIFVPAFAVGACGGRLFGEMLSMAFPEGLRGPGSPPIYPGLYAVVGAAAYTGAVTHSLSLAVIVCETTGQLCALLPVLIALMIANAICSFLSPSIYESTIILKKLPYLADLPPSRISVHVLKVERVMVKDVQFVSRNTTYKELRNMLKRHPNIGSFPFVTDAVTMTLLGSISRRYLVSLLCIKIGAQEILPQEKRRSKTPSELMQRRRSSGTTAALILTGRNESESHFRVNSPLHTTSPLAQLLPSSPGTTSNDDTIGHQRTLTIAERAGVLTQRIEIDDYAIDAAPFQLVKGTSLHKVHTMFSLLGLHHAYVTDKGKLLGVVSLKELRDTFADIYVRGAQLPPWRRMRRRDTERTDVENGNGANNFASSSGPFSASFLPNLLFTDANTLKKDSLETSRNDTAVSSFRTLSTPVGRSGTTAALILTGRNESESHFRVNSPLHTTSPLAQLLPSPGTTSNDDTIGHQRTLTIAERAGVLTQRIEIDDYAIDAAPFQLVKGTSLYKVHTMFSLLGLHHAYVTDKGKLLGVVSLKELRDTFADIYVRGAQLPPWRRMRRRDTDRTDVENGNGASLSMI